MYYFILLRAILIYLLYLIFALLLIISQMCKIETTCFLCVKQCALFFRENSLMTATSLTFQSGLKISKIVINENHNDIYENVCPNKKM